MTDIFISYAKEDRPRAIALASALKEQGWTVWWDRKIPPGRVFDEVITEALDTAKCVIVLWSRFSVSSNWVKEEAAEGARRKVLVPALIDDVSIPLGFKSIQAAQLIAWQTDRADPQFLQLLESVSQILGTKPEANPPPLEAPIDVRPISSHTLTQPKKHSEWLRWGAVIATFFTSFCVVLLVLWIAGIAILNMLHANDSVLAIMAILNLVLSLGISFLLAIIVWRRLR